MRRFKYYDLILALFAAVLLISNISATKVVSFGPIITDGGAVLFPIIYILGDILTEVYGYKHARRAIWMGFIIMILGGCGIYNRTLSPTGVSIHRSGRF
ncbi:MAG: VUT family protein [Candidatus Saccharimonadales bacterium]